MGLEVNVVSIGLETDEAATVFAALECRVDTQADDRLGEDLKLSENRKGKTYRLREAMFILTFTGTRTCMCLVKIITYRHLTGIYININYSGFNLSRLPIHNADYNYPHEHAFPLYTRCMRQIHVRDIMM